MKFKNKILTAIVSICMIAFILPMAVSAADNADSSDKNTITCYVRAEQDDGTILPYTKVTMNKDEVPSFQSYKIKNAPDDADYITPLHILLQALTDKGMTDELATVDIGSSGCITDMFRWGMDQLWCLNGIDAPTVSAQYKAKDGDKYTFYQAAGNRGAGYGYPGYGFFGEYGPGQDYTPYSAIETDDVTTGVGSDVELTYRYTSSMHTPQYGPCNNEDGAYTMIFVGKNGADKVTDEDYREDIEVDKDGKFKVSFDKPGTYVVSGRYYNNDDTRGACNAYCKVTVLDAVEYAQKTIDALDDITLNSEKAIEEAKKAYNLLTDKQKEQIKNADAIKTAEEKLSKLQVENAESKISAIGDVTLDSKDAIKDARDTYDALTDDQKKQVTNYDVLQKAESELSDLQKADAVVTKIKNIGTVTLKSESKIKQARIAYNKLTDKQKTLVTNYDVLEKAEKDLADLKAADQVSKNITNIGTVTLESEDAIKEARTAYDALTDTQKELVSNKDVLEKAESTLKELQDAKAADVKAAEEVTNKIDAIGDVTLESEDAIKEARTAYDALTDAQKELVSNKDVLEKAETTLKELKDAKDADDAKVAATPKSITLSNTRYIYNGKVQKPQVTVKNAKGEVIKGYTVKYAGNCKNVGKYKVTLTFKGDYNGTKTKTFKIAPKSVTVKSLKAAKKRFDVKWSKQTTQVTGYQVQYSTDKNFVKAVKNKKITKNSVVTKTVKNLKSKKVYYVRVRTYTTVKYNGEQMNLHSDWSKVKKVTVK